MVGFVKSFKQLAAENGGDTEIGQKLDEIDKGTRESMDGQVPRETTYDAWLKQKDKTDPEGVQEMLGPGRYDLWKKDKLSMSDLVDNRGNPLKIADL